MIEDLNQTVGVSFLQQGDKIEATVVGIVTAVGMSHVRVTVLDGNSKVGSFSLDNSCIVKLLTRIETPEQELERLRDANVKMSEHIEILQERLKSYEHLESARLAREIRS